MTEATKAAVAQLEIERLFTYHPPRSDQLPRYLELRAAGAAFAEVLMRVTPPGPDQSAALRKIREAVMTGNAAIALEPQPLTLPDLGPAVATMVEGDLRFDSGAE
jgi:hypothetical protein